MRYTLKCKYLRYGARLSFLWLTSDSDRDKQLLSSVVTCEAVKRREFAKYSQCAGLVGVATVSEGENVMLIGRNANISWFNEVIPQSAELPRNAASQISFGIRMNSPWDSTVEKLRLDDSPTSQRFVTNHDLWLGLNAVRHKVAELFPELRIWPDELDYDPRITAEVQLRPHHGGLRLGGCVWRPETYLDPAGRKYLRL